MQDNHIPVAAVVGGGYRTEQQELVPVHFQLIQAALNLRLDLDSDLIKNKFKTTILYYVSISTYYVLLNELIVKLIGTFNLVYCENEY